MIRVALSMLMGDRAKYSGLVLGVSFAAFLFTFAASYFCGIMTRGFALIAENPWADVWVMDPAVSSVEQTINMPSSALERVRGVEGVRSAVPLVLANVEARFPDGRFQPFQIVAVDDASLAGAPATPGDPRAASIRDPDAAIIDPGGTSGKLEFSPVRLDPWHAGGPASEAPTRPIREGDELLVNDHRVRIAGVSDTLPRFPPRPLLYMTWSNALRILPPERLRLTFVLASAAPGISPRALAVRIEAATGLHARASPDFKAETVRWYLDNSEDVGDIAAMLSIAGFIGFGSTGVLLFMFTADNLRQYAVLNALGARRRMLLTMVLAQSGLCGLIGTGLGLGACALIGHAAVAAGYPFRMMWFNPLLGAAAVAVVCLVAAVISLRPLFRADPAGAFNSR
jgi:putative ABC transport system permease protein